MRLLLALFTICVALPAVAHESGSWIVRGGPAMVAPNTDSDVIDVAGIVTLPGVEVDDNTQLGLTGTYMFSDHIGLELLAATPFKHDIEVDGIGLPAGDTKHLPPTLTLQYFPLQSDSRFQPYFGIGLNTTIFFEEDVSNELNLALDGIVGLPPGTVDADLSLDQSWGFAAEVGADYMINDHWLINASVWYIDIDTEAKISTAIADVKFDVEINPWVYMVSVGYRF